MNIDDLELTMRTTNCLKGAGIYLVNDLANCNKVDLLKIPNLGKKSLIEIQKALLFLGIGLKESVYPQGNIKQLKPNERQIAIFKAVLNGEAIKDCAINHGISTERVRQLYKKVFIYCNRHLRLSVDADQFGDMYGNLSKCRKNKDFWLQTLDKIQND